jgi:8-oxo-dGTP diphosphatase
MNSIPVRAGVVLLDGEQLALIERTRGPEKYYVLPGGMVDEGEDAQQAAKREAAEELGLDLEVGALVAEVLVTRPTTVSKQLYFLTRSLGGTFGSGTGEEFLSGPEDGHGTYRAVWRALDECLVLDVRPKDLVLAIAAGRLDELVRTPLRVTELKGR